MVGLMGLEPIRYYYFAQASKARMATNYNTNR